ncbi:hypothetical protein COV93_00220 [Candidatus Woesearchaeota archaeon CG11_big_fil_rev_8_21_14_0_20_43_8]|nr:MAG: hypothetical protein COV93_00220 [Candidatus Woesearchaeota archaeon CG11_big_fil_rev_8_21_14_0_20_43_8]PIO06139.1 MAG: hypothetical protein COT47_03465 [Candidatus Woesearchaeota archaeon CG08_land_8_20_14_0_20_43_7]
MVDIKPLVLWCVSCGVIGVIICFGFIFISGDDMVEPEFTAMNTYHRQNTIAVPGSQRELPKGDEGSVVLMVKPPVQILEQFSDVREYILFFSSVNEPDLSIAYNIQSKRFEAGSPVLSSKEIDIFDGRAHQLAYTYKRGMGQNLFLDGTLVNTSVFDWRGASEITGFAVSSVESYDVAEGFETKIAVTDYVVGSEILGGEK